MTGAITLRSPETVSALTEMGWSARMVTSPETLFTLADPPSRVRDRSPDTVCVLLVAQQPLDVHVRGDAGKAQLGLLGDLGA